MNELGIVDFKDYDNYFKVFYRTAVRAVIKKDNKLYMVHSDRDGYKFPGGGVNEGETIIQALTREVLEEAGLIIKPETVKEFGYVKEIRKSTIEYKTKFVHTSYYYFCEVEDEIYEQRLDDYERKENYHLVLIDPKIALQENSLFKNQNRREKLVLEKLTNIN